MASVAPLAGDGPDLDAIVTDLHRRYALRIYQFCRHQLGNREEAEDATQQTFIQVLRGLERGASLDSESGWLFTIARNVCLNSKRSSFRRGRVETPSTLYEFQEGRASMAREPFALHGLMDALEDLPPIQRRAILLREWQGLSYAEIASDLGLSQAAVETLLFRARKAVAAKLSGGSKRTTSSRIGDVGSLLTALKGLIAGAVPKLAVTAATVVTASAVGASVETMPAASSTMPSSAAATPLSARVFGKPPLRVSEDLARPSRSTPLPGVRAEAPAEPAAAAAVFSTAGPEPPAVQPIVSAGEGSQSVDDEPPASAADEQAPAPATVDRLPFPSDSPGGLPPSLPAAPPAPASPAADPASDASPTVTTSDALAPSTSPAPAGQDPPTEQNAAAPTPTGAPTGTGKAPSASRISARAVPAFDRSRGRGDAAAATSGDAAPAGAPGAARSASAKPDTDASGDPAGKAAAGAKRPQHPDTPAAPGADVGASSAPDDQPAARAQDPSLVAAGQAAVVAAPAKPDPPEASPRSSGTSGADAGTTAGRSNPPAAAGPPVASPAGPPTASPPGPPTAPSAGPQTAPLAGPPTAPSAGPPTAGPPAAPSVGPPVAVGAAPSPHAK